MAVPASVSTTRPARLQAKALVDTVSVRRTGALVIAVALGLFVIGTGWDIQWHVNVGRDRVFTAPHLMMLGGIALSGLVSLALVLFHSWRAWRSPIEAEGSFRLSFFHAPVGVVAAGVGALLGAIAFPLDDYWHTLYGVDVTLWAPFHIMIVASMVMVGVGALQLVAADLGAENTRSLRWTQGVFIALVAITFATLLVLLPQANAREGLVLLGKREIVLYPILLATSLPLALVITKLVVPVPGSATLAALVFLALRQLMFVFVPWAVDATVAAEGLALRAGAISIVILPYAYPTVIALAAVVVDILMWMVRGNTWRTTWLLGSSVVLAMLSVFWDRPWAIVLPRYDYPDLNTTAALFNALPFSLVGALIGVAVAAVHGRSLAAARH